MLGVSFQARTRLGVDVLPVTGLAGAVTGADFRAGRRRVFVVAFWLALAALLGPGTVGLEWASAQDAGKEREAFAETDVGAALVRHVWQGYKSGEAWPGRNFQGLDFLEPLVPRVAVARGDVGRIVVNSALPYALLTSAFAAESTDQSTYKEIKRWGWVGIDQGQDNQPFLIGLLGLAGASILPAHEDASGYSWALRADRATVFALGVGISAAETAMLKPVFDRKRPTETTTGPGPADTPRPRSRPWPFSRTSSGVRKAPRVELDGRAGLLDGAAGAAQYPSASHTLGKKSRSMIQIPPKRRT